MKLNWNFLGGQGVQTKNLPWGELWIFSGSAHFNNMISPTAGLDLLSGRGLALRIILKILSLTVRLHLPHVVDKWDFAYYYR